MQAHSSRSLEFVPRDRAYKPVLTVLVPLCTTEISYPLLAGPSMNSDHGLQSMKGGIDGGCNEGRRLGFESVGGGTGVALMLSGNFFYFSFSRKNLTFLIYLSAESEDLFLVFLSIKIHLYTPVPRTFVPPVPPTFEEWG